MTTGRKITLILWLTFVGLAVPCALCPVPWMQTPFCILGLFVFLVPPTFVGKLIDRVIRERQDSEPEKDGGTERKASLLRD
ncbi:MAG: hypothetical protein JNJ83_05805 [Verrucomicrobiaceae bacterium]|nr:hypothetical protein [Verrucomicrobiaceae bacterium]